MGTMLVHIFEAQTTPMPRTGEIHEMKPNKTGETVIHLEVYSSIHTVYLPTRDDRASMRDTAIQHDTAIHTSIQRDTMYRMYHHPSARGASTVHVAPLLHKEN